MQKNNLNIKENFLNKILKQKIGKIKLNKIGVNENILKNGVIDSMDFAEIFFLIEKKFKIKIQFEKIFGKNSHISIKNIRKCLKIKN